MSEPFEIELDARARAWLKDHPDPDGGSIVIAYEEHRCCGGGKICDVHLRPQKAKEPKDLVRIGEVAGRALLLDRRILGRLPRRLPLTVRGVGPFRGLGLDLSGEQWGDLLYA